MRTGKKKVKKILFITLNNLGDIILTTPAFTRLVSEFPDAEMDVMTGEPGKEIFSAHPSVRKVMLHTRKKTLTRRLAEVSALRKQRYDLVCDLKNSLLPYLLGSAYGTGPFSLYRKRYFMENNIPPHKVNEHLYKIKKLVREAPFRERSFFMPISREDENVVLDIMGPCQLGRKRVIINPGAKSHLKRWPAASYAKLSDRITGELGCAVLITGNKDDLDAVRGMKAVLRGEAVDFSARTTLGALTLLISKADLIITNDSAPLHVASAVNTPTIAIFGPTDETKYGPLSDKRIVLKPVRKCRPCGRALCRVGPDEGCIGEVTVDEVFNAVKRILDQRLKTED